MKIKKLGIGGYGRFTDREITFSDGLNLVFGKNEAGKSTLQAYIKAMLFDHPRKNVDGEGRLPDRTKYKPWTGSAYGGILELTTDDGRQIKIDRDFNRKEASVFDGSLRDITGEFPYTSREGLRVGEKLLNMDRECFENTAFITQGGTVVLHADRKNLFEKLMNLSLTGDEDTSVASAKKALAEAKKNIGHNQTKNRPYNIASRELQKIALQKDEADRIHEEMSDNILRQGQLERELIKLEKEIKEYNKTAEKAKLLGEQAELQLIKGKYDKYTEDLENISSEIFTLRQELEKNTLPESITEEDILDNIKTSASGAEKQKSLGGINAEKGFGILRNFRKNKLLKLILSATGMVISVIIALLTHFVVFALTAALAVLFIYFLMSKPEFTEKELAEHLKIHEECQKELALVNSYIEAAGRSKAGSFEEASSILNTMFDMKRNSVTIENQLKRLEDRKGDLTGYRNGVTGNSNISDINERLLELKKVLSEPNVAPVFVGENPQDEYNSRKSELTGIRAVLDKYMQSEEEAAALEEELDSVRSRLDAIETEKRAMDLASTLIDEAAKGLQEEIIPELNEKAGVILGNITSGTHSSLHTGLDNEINTEFDNNIRSLWEFSDGTIDQMYFALRIAASDVFSEKETVPVIIDEAFAYYDEDRIVSTFELLSEIASDRQVIIFTCKEQEIELASKFDNVNVIEI